MALYNVMRPMRFSDVRGQDKTVKIIRDNIRTGNLPNAMLLIGTRGIGKTTIAKIIAKTLNCEHPTPEGECCDECPSCIAVKQGNSIDVLELDAASNNGVDHIRSIIEKVKYKPVGKMRVVILDEVHMLSISAFNSLLKLLEEPPANTLFILCTTEVHKIPITILSRCRKFQFETISEDVIIEKLEEVNRLYGLTADAMALRAIAMAAKGSMRDAESIYENFLDVENGHITVEIVRDVLGLSDDETVFLILNGILSGDATLAFNAIQQTVDKGGSLVYLVEETFRILMDIVSLQTSGDISMLVGSSQYIEQVSEFAFNNEMSRFAEIADGLRKVYEQRSGNLELVFQSTILELICRQSSISELRNRILKLETTIEQLKNTTVAKVVSADEMRTMPVEPEDMPETFSDENVETSTDLSAELGDSGFIPLSKEQEEELASLGFSVDTSQAGSNSNENTSSNAVNNSQDNSCDSNDYFSGFASILGSFGW